MNQAESNKYMADTPSNLTRRPNLITVRRGMNGMNGAVSSGETPGMGQCKYGRVRPEIDIPFSECGIRRFNWAPIERGTVNPNSDL